MNGGGEQLIFELGVLWIVHLLTFREHVGRRVGASIAVSQHKDAEKHGICAWGCLVTAWTRVEHVSPNNPILVMFLIATIKYLAKTSDARKGLVCLTVWGNTVHCGRKVCWKEYEMAGHSPEEKRWILVLADSLLPFHLYSVIVPCTFRAGLPSWA